MNDFCSASEGRTGYGKDSKAAQLSSEMHMARFRQSLTGELPPTVAVLVCVCVCMLGGALTEGALIMISRTPCPFVFRSPPPPHCLSLPPSLHLAAAGSQVMLSHPLLPVCANYTHDKHDVQQHRCHGAFNLIWEELADPEPEPPACPLEAA